MSRRIGCIFAHPDDETFCVGGIIAKYAAAGATIDLFCATDGDAGKHAGIPVSSRAELGALRREELRTACRILGIASIDFGGFGDGTLAGGDPDLLVGRIVAFIRRTHPDILLTLGPEGAPTHHPDHRAISRAATAAFFLAALRGTYVEQQLAPFHATRLFYHAWKSPLPAPRAEIESVAPTAAIDVRAFRQRKEEAFRAHATQQGSAAAFYELALEDVEYLAFAAGEPQPAPMIDDVFAGL
jgi:LmbE family N-acetylglucosaminyl deacetylase